ncbi:MAG: helix-turn-helix domain-containing protein [Rhodospirillales bacterium]
MESLTWQDAGRPAERHVAGTPVTARLEYRAEPAFGELDAAIEGAAIAHCVLEPASLAGCHVRLRSGHLCLDYLRYPASVAVQGVWTRRENAYSFLSGPGRRWTGPGIEHRGDTVEGLVAGTAVRAYLPAGSEWLVVWFPTRGAAENAGIAGMAAIPPRGLRSEAASALRRQVGHLVSLAEAGGTERQVAQLVEALAGVARDALTASAPLPGPGGVRARRFALVQRAEAFAAADPCESLRIPELSRAAGASERLLEYAFRDVYNRGASRCLRLMRLNGARRDLSQATGGRATVTTVAMEWGFFHLSAFAGAYRRIFGELPSDTARLATRRKTAPRGAAPRRRGEAAAESDVAEGAI